ncbi:MAG: protein translocase subunit SecD [Fibrobacter sp.]|nr:protein translocase subunit SecD [Fibrobacter sp.]
MNKKIFGMRELIILAVFLISCYSLWPSIQIHSKSGEAKELFVKEHPKLAAKSINFGLDLAGGTSITLEIDKSKLKADDVKDVQSQSLEIIRNRVDQYGLSEPQISPSGDNRIVVELAGVDDSSAKELVGSTARLEFKILAEDEKFAQVVTLIDNYVSRLSETSPAALTDTPAVADSAKTDSAAVSADSLSDEELLASTSQPAAPAETSQVAASGAGDLKPLSGYFISGGNGGFISEDAVEKVKQLLSQNAIQNLIPRDVDFAWGSGLEKVSQNSNVKAKRLYLLNRRVEMGGEDISDARPFRGNDGEVTVSLKFSGIGPKKFSAVTAANKNKRMAIVLDDQVISAPTIRDRIPNGEAQITGLEDIAEANRLAIVLRAGALKAPMQIVESRNIGATLGAENIRSGFSSALFGLIACLLFMVVYYRVGGVISSVGMFFNVLVTAAVLSVFHATLTLPGIAGFILAVAMALDANVIIYERVREELRIGLTARAAIAKGYEKAFSAIFDSNLTTFLTALILYKIGTGAVKGFGLTLMIGIAASMFCALTVTRSIFDIKLAKHDSTKLSLGNGLRALNEANFAVVSKSKLFAMFSGVLIIISIALAVVKGFDFSIDFTGGQVYTVQYQDSESHEKQLLADLGAQGFNDITVRKTGAAGTNFYQINVKESQGQELQTALTNVLAKSEGAKIIANDTVGPTIGKELRFYAILSVILSWLVICIYIWFRFGKLGLGFGVGAVVGLIHDTIITIGLISLLGLSVDGALIAALLTMIGYSVNDTIVVFDRIRENVALHGRSNFGKLVDASVSQSFSRTIVTSMTTLFVCGILAVMGGTSIRDFALVLVIGIVVGTYSTICICSPFVVWWSKRFKSGI